MTEINVTSPERRDIATNRVVSSEPMLQKVSSLDQLRSLVSSDRYIKVTGFHPGFYRSKNTSMDYSFENTVLPSTTTIQPRLNITFSQNNPFLGSFSKGDIQVASPLKNDTDAI